MDNNTISRENIELNTIVCSTDKKIEISQDSIRFFTNNEERLQITPDGRFIMSGSQELSAPSVEELYHTLLSIFGIEK